MDKPRDRSGHARMRPRARLIALIGDELISDERVAIVELVKNAYDADANEVAITFEASPEGPPNTLVISDDGHGMSLDTVLESWFEPGTVMKKKDARSPGGRMYQGAKGVGRFAAARLGATLFMETKREGDEHAVHVLLEWGRFDDDSYLDEVEVFYETVDADPDAHGTKLIIENVRSRKAWEEDDFHGLYVRLSRLVSPFKDVHEFTISLDVPGHPSMTGQVDAHEITREPKYLLAGALDEHGRFSGRLEVDGDLAKEYEDHPLGGKDEVVACGGFSIEVRAWDRDRAGLAPYMLKYDMTITKVRQLLNNYCGVSIYRDGFRVHPYGELGNDWLGLDARSRQIPARCLANNQVIGSIQISRETNPDLLDRTTREGLVHNEAQSALTDWFVRGLALLEEERYRIRPREETKPEYTKTIFEAFDLSDVVGASRKQLGAEHPITRMVREKDGEVREGVKRLQEHYSRVLMAAGMGQLVDIVIHEIGAPLARISRELRYIETNLGDCLDEHEDLAGSFKNARIWLDQIGSLRARLDPRTAGKRGRATSFRVSDEIASTVMLFETLLAKQNIKLELETPDEPIVVHMNRSNLGQIVANLVDNSIFWLTRHHGDAKGGRILIRVENLEHGFRVLLSDDGPGIPTEDQDLVFDPYFSRKPNGMGLGLFIAREVIEPYGRVVLRDDCELPGACIEVRYERGVGV